MSNTERLRFYGPAEAAARRGGAEAEPARTALPPLVEHLLLFGLFAGGAGFWIAVIWWIVR
jgi:hypothetical protein